MAKEHEVEVELSEEAALQAEVQKANDDRQKEVLRRQRLGLLWIFISLAWWFGTIVPIIYVVGNAGQ